MFFTLNFFFFLVIKNIYFVSPNIHSWNSELIIGHPQAQLTSEKARRHNFCITIMICVTMRNKEKVGNACEIYIHKSQWHISSSCVANDCDKFCYFRPTFVSYLHYLLFSFFLDKNLYYLLECGCIDGLARWLMQLYVPYKYIYRVLLTGTARLYF